MELHAEKNHQQEAEPKDGNRDAEQPQNAGDVVSERPRLIAEKVPMDMPRTVATMMAQGKV